MILKKLEREVKEEEQKVSKFWGEFKQFALRGNAFELAVGVVIGTAFNKIVTSLVNDIIMPIVGKLIGNADFSTLYIALDRNAYENLDAARAADAPVLAYGAFIQNVIDFVLIALSIFVVVKVVNRLHKRKEEKQAEPKPTKEQKLLTEIRDILKSKK